MNLPQSENKCILAVRASTGLFLREGAKEDGRIVFEDRTKAVKLSDDDENSKPQLLFCRVCRFNPTGSMLAYCDSVKTRIVDTTHTPWTEIFCKDLPKTAQIIFSPKSTLLLTWEVYYHGKDRAEGEPNLRVWNVASGELVSSYVCKKQQGWEPQFSDDEKLCLRLVGSELLCHVDGNLSRYERKHVVAKMADYSLSKGGQPLHVACYVPVAKGQPGVVRILNCKDFAPVASKTFWKADRVSMRWNKKGSAVIIMAITDVDSTGQSYYGEQNLYLVMTNGEGFMVPLGKNGPVYHLDWNPNSSEFCVVYGYMPAKATLYNLKGEPVMDFGTGPRNECHYNNFGNVLCICGFGNLRGNMEFWSPADKKKICQVKAEDTTFFQWAPDGKHFVTATTAPRLRVNNGYKFWTYTGQTVSEVKFPEGRELWEVSWKPENPEIYAEFHIDYAEASTTPTATFAMGAAGALPGVNKDAVYVPPHLRDKKARTPGSAAANNTKPAPKGTVGSQKDKSGRGGLSEKQKKIKTLQKKLNEIESLKTKRNAGENLQTNQVKGSSF